MEKHKCDICLKRFVNGRALDTHMRSHHLTNLYREEEEENHEIDFQTSVSSSSSSEDDDEDEPEEEEEKNNLLSYALRENPKKSIRLVDQEFSFVVEPGSGSSVILQDRESETESSKNPIRRRSKRIRRRLESPETTTTTTRNGYSAKKIKIVSPEMEPEPVSSISYTSPDEDVAYCLMMLKRDKWVVKDEEFGEDEDEFVQSDGDGDGDESDAPENNNKKIERKNRGGSGGRYKCETCYKVYRSYQALGGHRASHKKIRINPIVETNQETNDGKTGEEKIHECPVCYRVFASGQALGGHKRSHVVGAATPVIHRRPPPAPAARQTTTKFVETLIDLNLPAPMEDEDFSQVELSAVSDR